MFIISIKEAMYDETLYSFKKIGNITYYFDRYNKIVGEREEV